MHRHNIFRSPPPIARDLQVANEQLLRAPCCDPACALTRLCVFLRQIENRSDCSALQDYLAQLTGARSVPRVFIDGKCIGGGDDTERLARSGELQKMLQGVGVAA